MTTILCIRKGNQVINQWYGHGVPCPYRQKQSRKMKKTYMAPAVEVIKVDVANMMATSMPIVDGTVNTNNIADQLSREMNRSAELLEQLWQ